MTMSRMFVFLFCALVALGTTGAEIALGDSPLGPSPMFKGQIEAAAGDDGFFVAWLEYRNGLRVTGTRVAADGTVLDPLGIVLDTIPAQHYAINIGVQWTGAHYETTVTAAVYDKDKFLYDTWSRISVAPDGRIAGRQNSIGKLPAKWPVNAAGETVEFSENGPLTMWVVEPDGGRWPVVIGGGGANTVRGVLPDGEDWLVVTIAATVPGITWYRVQTSTGKVVGQRTVIGRASQLAGDGTSFALLAEEMSNVIRTYSRRLTLTIVDRLGNTTTHVLHEDIVTIQEGQSAPPYGEKALVPDNGGWLAVWTRHDSSGAQELRTYRVAGRTTESTLAQHYPASRQDYGLMAPLLVTGPTRNLLVYQRPRETNRSGGQRVFVTTFDRGALPDSSRPQQHLSYSIPPQAAPSAASGPHGTLAAWQENVAPETLRVRFFPTSGPAPEPLEMTAGARSMLWPLVVRNGETFLVAWQELSLDERGDAERYRIVVRRFDAHGVPVDAAPLTLFQEPRRGGTALVAGAEGDGFRLAWIGGTSFDNGFLRTRSRVHTLRIGASGNESAKPDILTAEHVPVQTVDFVSDGDDSLLLWLERPGETTFETRGLRYTKGVAARTSELISSTSFAGAAAGNGQFLLSSIVADGSGQCVEARRYTFAGQPLGPAQTVTCSPKVESLTTTWSGDRWWIATASADAPLTRVWKVDANGIPSGAVELMRPELHATAPFLFATERGPSLVYVRPDENSIDRAFMRAVEAASRRRAARH